MKLINFVSNLDMNQQNKVSLTMNVDDIKNIQPELNIINVKTGKCSRGYSIYSKSRKNLIPLNVNDYEIIQEFLSNDDKYLEMKVEWL